MLWGLLAVSIPVIIHLFNFRRHKRVYFTNVKHLQELKQQTRRQSRLRHLLVLAARILAIASLVFAFSQPFIPAAEVASASQGGHVSSIYIDNSFSMEAEATNGELLALARMKAAEIARSYRSSDLFQLLTNDFEGQHQRLVSLEEFLEMVEEVELSPVVQPLSSVLQRQQEILMRAMQGSKSRFILSDFQKSITDFDSVDEDSLIATYLLPQVAQDNGNIYIDSCWFDSPVHQLGQGVKLSARIMNASENDFEKLPVKLTINGVQKALGSFDVQAGSSTVVELPYTSNEPGIQYGTLEISDYPVTFDDRFYLVYVVQPAIPVLTVHGEDEPVFLNSLLASDSAFSYHSVHYKNISYDLLASYFLIILDGLPEISSGLQQALSDYCTNGGSLLVIPGNEMDIASYREFSSSLGVSSYRDAIRVETSVSALDLENPVFRDVFEEGRLGGKRADAAIDLPKVKAYYPIAPPESSYSISLMRLISGQDFMVAEQAGTGKVYLLSVPLDDRFSNFQRHALFVPVIYRIALLSGATSPLFHTIGSQEPITVENTGIRGEEILKIVNMEQSLEVIPGQRNTGSSVSLMVFDQITLAGHYQVRAGEAVVKGLAFNYDRRESRLETYTEDELESIISDQGLTRFFLLDQTIRPVRETLEQLNQGKQLWKLFITFALFFLAVEVFLLRVWSTF